MHKKPLVSIGMPVYNAEGSLRRAIDALLMQDYRNIELVISDNASTDGTEEICREYTAKDARVLYYRSDRNMGQTWNYDRVFELSRGKYFMWSAHDDVRAESFITKCVERLEANQNAVLCPVYTELKIEGDKNVFMINTIDNVEGISSLKERYRRVYKHLPSTAMYGLMRSDAVKKTLLFQHHVAADVAWLQELCLYGEFTQVREVLFSFMRRKKWNTLDQDYTQIFPGKKKPGYYMPFMILALAHIRRLFRSPLGVGLKLYLAGFLAGHEIKVVLVKLCLRLAAAVNRGNCPDSILKCAEKILLDNPNIRITDEAFYDSRIRKVKYKAWLGKY